MAKSKTYILITILLLAIIIAGVIYFRWSPAPEAEPPQADVNLPLVSNSPLPANSPVSPVSPPPTTAPAGVQPIPEEIQAMIEQGIALYENGQSQAALDLFTDILTKAPANFLAYNGRGTVYTDQQDYDQALADYTAAIEANPLFPHAYYNRGRVYRLLDRNDEALADLQKAIDLAPAEFGYRANGNIGLIHHNQGEYDQALEAFGKSIDANIDNKADIYFFRGETYTALENYEAAQRDYQAAVDRFANYDEAYAGLGYAQYKIGNFDEAQQALNRALEIAPANTAAQLYSIVVAIAAGNPDQAQTAATELAGSQADSVVLSRVLAELDTLAAQAPDQAEAIDSIKGMLPAP